jgi:3-phenylpropionate/trans-cinnamate dioxygenase ferredoxin component
MSDWVEVARVGDIAAGELKAVEYDGAMIVLFNLDGSYHALDDVCTHDGGPLSDGVIQGEEVVCPRHGARFAIRTGAVTAPPAVEPVRRLAVRVEDGRILVREDGAGE